jgi:ubiquinone/menaquinone biosynthesis C-methylase UbiE
MDNKKIKNIVRKGYSEIAEKGCGCGCATKKISGEIGYSKEEINLVPKANLGLGCGNPVALSTMKPGDIVLDLGSGAGFDCFLAAKKVGEKGKVIGVDMTKEMISKARKNAEEYGFKNVEFKLGEIENLPIEDDSIDIVISNCVINLSPDKEKVFKEVYRVLKKGGKMYLSDIVLLGNLTKEQKNSNKLLCGCVAGAMQKEKYLELIRNSRFKVKILSEDKEISKKQYQGIALESIKIQLTK